MAYDQTIEFVRRFLTKPEIFWKKALRLICNEPDISFDEVNRELSGDRNKETITVQIDLSLFEELKRICLKRHKEMHELIPWILEEWIDKWEIFARFPKQKKTNMSQN